MRRNQLSVGAESFITIGLPSLTLLLLAIVTLTNTTEFYDAFTYILSGMHLWGDSSIWHPKVPLITAFFGIVHAPFSWMSTRPPLVVFHIASFLVNVIYLVALALWLQRQRFSPHLRLSALIGIAAWNDLFIHYAPFSLSDFPATLTVVAWLLATSSTDPSARIGILARAGALALVAFGRPQLLLIVAPDLAWECWRARRFKEPLLAVAGSLLVFLLASAIFYSIGYETDLLDGLYQGLGFALQVAGANAALADNASLTYFGYLFRSLSPVGFALAATGGVILLRKPSQLRHRMIGLVAGAGLYFLFILRVGNGETRYLAPLLPLLALFQCVALTRLWERSQKMALAALIALFVAITPELIKFSDPYYRLGIHRSTSEKIALWSATPEVLFPAQPRAINIHPLHPQNPSSFWREREFYANDFSGLPFLFFSGVSYQKRIGPLSYTQYGYPFPDQIEQIAPQGVTIVPPPESHPAIVQYDELKPIYAVRWWPKTDTPTGAMCLPAVSTICLESLTAFEGLQWKR